MARDFPETAHLNTDKKKYDEGHERIFGKRDDEKRMAKKEELAELEKLKKEKESQ